MDIKELWDGIAKARSLKTKIEEANSDLNKVKNRLRKAEKLGEENWFEVEILRDDITSMTSKMEALVREWDALPQDFKPEELNSNLSA